MSHLSKNKKIIIFYLILAILFINVFSFVFDKKPALNGDNLTYFTLAKSILQGGYTTIANPGNHYTNGFPPGYPLLLSIVMIFTKNIIAFKIYNGLFLLAGVFFLSYTLIKNEENKIWYFLAFSAASLFNPDILSFATMLMSEMSYFFFISLTFFFLYKNNKDNPIKDIYFWLMLVSAVYAYHIRTAAIAIMGGVLLYYLFNKKWYHLILSIAGYVVGLLPWMIRNKIRGLGGSRYLSQMTQVNAWDVNAGTLDAKGMLGRFWENFTTIVTKELPDALFSANVNYRVDATFGEWAIGLVLLALIIFGLFQIKKFNYFFIGLLLTTGATLLPWNGGGGTRYIIAIIPFLYLGLFSSAYFLCKKIINKPVILNAIPIVFAVIIFAIVKPELERWNNIATSDYHPAYKNYLALAESVKKNTPENTLICCRKPTVFYFFSDRQCARYAFSSDDKVVIRKMYDANYKYVVLEQLGYGSTPRYLYPAIKKNPQVFKPVIHLKKPDTYLLEFNRKEAEKVLGIQPPINN